MPGPHCYKTIVRIVIIIDGHDSNSDTNTNNSYLMLSMPRITRFPLATVTTLPILRNAADSYRVPVWNDITVWGCGLGFRVKGLRPAPM